MAVALTFVHWLSVVVPARSLHLPSRTSANLESTTFDKEACSSQKAFCEQARPRFHFTAATNWLNDPNGLHYYEGVYHMYFQHSINKTWIKGIFWGHAVSKDLLHWHQLDNALVAEEGGAWSGSAVVDVANRSGLQTGSKPAVLAFYTHVDYKTQGRRPLWLSSQRLVFSNDGGRSFSMRSRDGEVIIPTLPDDKNLARDPKVVWHEASQKWILVLWEGPNHTGLYSSENLLSWEKLQDLEVEGFECPDFFELKVDGEDTRFWVLWFASSIHYIGTFNGKKFKIEGEPRTAEYGMGYASQTFDNMPNGRRVQISWVKWKSPMPPEQEELPFIGSMSIPMEMDLIRLKNDTVRVRRLPVSEVSTIWQDLPPAGMKAVRKISGSKLVEESSIETSSGLGLDIEIDAKVDTESSLELHIQGQRVTLTPDSVASEHQHTNIVCEPHCLQRLPIDSDHRIKLRILSDRSSLEIFDLVGGTSMAVIPVSSHCHNGNDWVSEIRLKPVGSVKIQDLQVREISDKGALCKQFDS